MKKYPVRDEAPQQGTDQEARRNTGAAAIIALGVLFLTLFLIGAVSFVGEWSA